MPNIFSSYRRDDTGGYAGRLSDVLQAGFGPTHVFMDVEAIAAGANYEDAIRNWIAECRLALVLVGPRWLSMTGPDGARRIDTDGDPVVLEIVTALRQSGVTVVPVLLDGTRTPSEDELPPQLKPLAKLNAYDLSNKRWDYEVGQIETFARRYDRCWWRTVYRTPRAVLRTVPAVIVAAIAAVVVVLVVGGSKSASSHQSPAQHVAACERNHGMAAASVSRPPGTGETAFTENQVLDSDIQGSIFQPETYASCTWPPGPGADPDGYRAITTTLTNGPGTDSVAPNLLATVIESKCTRIKVLYSLSQSGDQQPLPPFVARPNQIWEAGIGNQPAFHHVDEIGSSTEATLDLLFYPPLGSIVVLTSAITLQKLTCLS